MRDLERFTKPLILFSVFSAAVAELSAVFGLWHGLPAVTAAAFLAGALTGWSKPRVAWRTVMFACYLTPALVLSALGVFYAAGWVVWMAGLFGVMCGTTPITRWFIPDRWRVPLVFWALVVATAWPIMVLREADFRWFLIKWNNVSWMTTTAMMTMGGILLFDAFFANFADSADTPASFDRDVAIPMGMGWVVAACAGVYQMVGDVSFLNPFFWSVLRRATGTLVEANAFGVISAMWGPALFAVALEQRDRRIRYLAGAALPVSWIVVWASGSRSSLLIAVLGLLALALQQWRLRGTRRTLVLTTAAGILVLAVAMSARGAIADPMFRFVRDFSPRWSTQWVTQMAWNLWTRGEYGPVAELMIKRSPVLGVGAGSFQFVFPAFSWLVYRVPVPSDNAQNWFRHQLAELGIVGSLGWMLWVLSFVWVLVTARAKPGRSVAAMSLRAVIAGFGLISLLGVPAQEVAVSFTFWTMAFWVVHLLSIEPRGGGVTRLWRPSQGTWAAALTIVMAYTAATAFAAQHVLRPPVRAALADMNYAYGFSEPPEGIINGAPFRWASRDALSVVRLERPWLELSVWVNHLDIDKKPVDVKVWVNDQLRLETRLTSVEPVTRYLRLPTRTHRVILQTWVSRVLYPPDFGVPDNRQLGLLVRWDSVNEPPPGASVIQ